MKNQKRRYTRWREILQRLGRQAGSKRMGHRRCELPIRVEAHGSSYTLFSVRGTLGCPCHSDAEEPKSRCLWNITMHAHAKSPSPEVEQDKCSECEMPGGGQG
jgi:hypothetical protein